jgi:hypothetical protein
MSGASVLMGDLLRHMDVGSRNARLCETLQSLGLFVVPIYAEDDPERIDYMHVSAAIPAYERAKDAACGSVAEVMPSAEVAEHVGPAKAAGVNVIDFPAVSR